jgi:hypothetical protein
VCVVRLSRGDTTDLLRSVGGLLFAAGSVVLFARKSGHHGWSDFALLLVVLIPAVVLYVLTLGVLERPGGDRPRPWQSVLMVAAILLWPVALFEFLHLIGASTHHPLYVAAVFALTALLPAYAARHARIRYAALLAGLSSLIAWLYVWEKILHHPSANTGRWLLVAAGVLLLIVAVGLARARAIGASEIATAGGIATVAAGVLGVIVGGLYAAFRPLTMITEGSGAVTSAPRRVSTHPVSLNGMPRAVRTYAVSHHGVPPRPLALHRAFPVTPIPHGRGGSALPSLVHVAHTSGLQHFGWDIYLLVVSVALILVAARWHIRGLGYVGGIGLLAFIISVAAQITRLEAGRAPTTSVIGWPLVLIVAGVVGLVAPVLYRGREPRESGPS